MAQEMRESTLAISKGYLEEVDFGEAIWMAPASLPETGGGEKKVFPLT